MIDEHSQQAYDKAVENFRLWKERGWLVQDPKENYYVYAQTMDDRTQYGLVVAAHWEDYKNGRIKKHELTRLDTDEDRMIHVRNQNANIEPVFFSYQADAQLAAIVSAVTKQAPDDDFSAEEGFGQAYWLIVDE